MLKQITGAINSIITAAKGQSASISFDRGVIGGASLTGWYTGKVTAKNIIKDGYAMNNIVYACTKFIASNSSQANWSLMRETANRKSRTIKRLSKMKPTNPKAALMKASDMNEVETHKIIELLETPNEYQSQGEFFEFVISMKVLTGNAFIFKQRTDPEDPKSNIVRLIPLASNYTTPQYDRTGNPSSYLYHADGLYLKIKPSDIIWWSEFSASHYSYLGISRYEAAGYSVEKSNNANISGASMMKKGGMVGVFSQKSNAQQTSGTARGLTQEQKEKFERDLYERGQNPHGYGTTLITSLDLSWNPVGFKPSEMDFGGIQLEALREICRVNNLQPVIFGDSSASTYNNMREAKKDSIIDGVLPELDGLRDALNKHLVGDLSFRSEKGLFLDYDPYDIPELQDDFEKLTNWLKEAYWIKGADKQRIMNMPADEDDPVMNEYLIPRNMVRANDLLEQDNIEDILSELQLTGSKEIAQNGNGHK